jgi:DNA repair photolyase
VNTQPQNMRKTRSTKIASFTTRRKGKGTREWAERSYNICDGCLNGCLYCFAKAMRARFDPSVRPSGAWQLQGMKPGTAYGTDAGENQVVMFPTAHDITPPFVDQSLRTIKNLLAANNQVLIVSKPHLSVVETLCRELAGSRENILFRFTIGSLSASLCAFWEPDAPEPAERSQALKHAYEQGFLTSISIEPMLDSVDATIVLVGQLEPFVTDTIWIGKMQRIPVKLNAHVPGFASARDLIKQQQTDTEIQRLVRHLRGHKKVRWKDSIQAVIQKKSTQGNGVPSQQLKQTNQKGKL